MHGIIGIFYFSSVSEAVKCKQHRFFNDIRCQQIHCVCYFVIRLLQLFWAYLCNIVLFIEMFSVYVCMCVHVDFLFFFSTRNGE